MAAGTNVPELGGYDYEFTSKIPEDWECPVCCLTLKDPVQIVGCGHRLCNICMESVLRSFSPRCPVDRQPLLLEKIFPDAACHRKILNLAVRCPHAGCSWTGELRAVEEHQSECLFKVVKCSNSGCTKMLSKKEMKTHETIECSWRKVDCQYCQQSVIMNQKQKHFEICRTFPVLCTNKCGLRDIPREKLEAHILGECPATEVQCEYKNLGCEEVFPRSAAKSHSQTQIESHLSLALRGLEATQYQVHELVTVVKEQSQQIERQSQQIKELISKDKEQSQQIKHQSQHIEQQSQQMERQSQQIEKLISNDKEQSETIERLMSTAQDDSLQRGRRGSMNQIFHTPFEWKISTTQCVNKGLLSRKIFVSEPFYLFQGGYRYILKVSSTVTYGMEAAIKVVPGEFDDSLSWPCKEKVRVMLIDQQQPLVSLNDISGEIDLGKSKKPCSRPFHADHHEYHCILRLTRNTIISYITSDTILFRVSRV